MSTIDKNQVVDDQIQIPVELCKRGSGLSVVLLTLPRGYFREPFFIDSLARSFSILKPEIKLPDYKGVAKKVIGEITPEEKNTEVSDKELEDMSKLKKEVVTNLAELIYAPEFHPDTRLFLV